ncbi:ArpU family phage packaging/lysis transcriptional regulator [Brevibacillus porteri]|uniref:ArpU family transcriptional regulator n=1 Tax=Brevibacillus porteri TaxID=2126350 RepID=A0ABX5FG25_9BACL|nr:ArpU family phage packaging/lysis transcriptional regulator [Brevibacillus porteri]MED1802087.1 ArpU family phage packaging/lysis transcriptional regulator [Brevibacillus porteri]MED2133147.1 ArpU family phage packaging/lysis transcriptional regulator [Brevibacillus porteri]MED2748686.1 ArpU family phage packaging/lysis transcriptional regulator [Brevibacillus porteri]MED2813358.1 ArpU family phage packaging/lysis transcriptional regulator [Brevibacillus porteri]MED4899545.1 ArpU family pha
MSAQVQEQLSFLQPVNETEVRKAVVKELKEYKALRVAVQNRQELREKGIGQLFPRLQPTETINELKAKQIDRALQYSLDEIERRIVEEKYLSTSRVKDINVYLDLGLTKDQYYTKKKDAIRQIATALGMI